VVAAVEPPSAAPVPVAIAPAPTPPSAEPAAVAEATGIPVAERAAQAAAASGAGERCQQAMRGKRNKDILAFCTVAFAEDAGNADVAVALAKVELDRGRFLQAYAWSKKAIAINPESAEAYVFAGGAEQSRGHGKAAKEAYLHYLRLAPAGRYAAELRAIVGSL
jgi:tetratricopeptide (TPR) repeat protein